VCNGKAAQVASDIAEITGVQQAEGVTGPYMPAKMVPMLSQRCQDSVEEAFSGARQDRRCSGICVSTLRHEPFGYQRLATTMVL
jgi:hypothetical protein